MKTIISVKQARKLSTVLIPVILACLTLSERAQAVTPAPDGGYPNDNTAEGEDALFSLTTTGTANTAEGFRVLFSNTTGSFNTANGFRALEDNTTGVFNTASGAGALASNTMGSLNTAEGSGALFRSRGSNNVALGFQAGYDLMIGNGNVCIGSGALFNNTGSSNVALGFQAGGRLTTGDNNIDIGASVLGVAGESNTIRIGNDNITTTIIGGINGTMVTGAAVLVASNGQLGTMSSSARFKQAIKPMGNASEALLALKPVTFRYKKEIDPEGTPQFGLVAEDVEKVNPDLVVRDKEGKLYTVRYDQVNAMLLNEFLKEHRTVQELEATVARQHKDFQATAAHQQKQIEALTAGLQKVSAQLEASKSAPQVVNNP